MKNIIISVFLFLSPIAYSEHCWQGDGCKGMIGYIVLPEEHYTLKHGDTGKINGKPYTVEAEYTVFGKPVVPSVGDTLKINTDYHELLGTYSWKIDLEAISRTYRSRRVSTFKWSKDNSSAILRVSEMQLGAGNQLSDGTEVKILNIHLLKEFLPEITDQHLLLLVQVISEPS